MRIGMVVSEYPESGAGHGGLATYTYSMANALSATGNQVIILQKEGMRADTLNPGVSVRAIAPMPEPGLRGRLLRRLLPEIAYQRGYSFAALTQFNAIYKEHGLDVVQIPEYNGEASTFTRVPYGLVVRLHSPTFLIDRLNKVAPTLRRRAWYRLERVAIDNARAITASSNAIRSEVCAYWGIDEKTVTVIRNPVDIAHFHPAPREEAQGPVRILFAGRLERRKGVFIITAMVRELLRAHPDALFTVAGGTAGDGGMDYAALIREAAGNCADRVEFLGPLPRASLPAVYQKADIFFIPSLFDNSPNTLFEAMASGCACVGSDVGGINEMIDNGINGLLFDITRPVDALDKLGLLIANRGLRKTLAAAARRKMEQEHDPDSIAAQTVSLYRTLSA
ncbi:MAG: hypothetical protein A2268_07780 [Candidatus Raymondbacteria bacterium RifOxyA12_full_50_37]|uniref:Glycosyltransferase subfamily 4-like N-terminal domain-containing protein n=1 Tax=Candidatus Raymondbacteria bacterium RIFOXYD12_FULL_49_13 TaxID=1817890 RepID=A0A1F7F7H3_UNCRA|nr:MAG: hypothetical protein A2268_07780 [Candidatus Raymondbacteria bacterium RifOxyA12_full_50_37]OGJ88953.1 MAG: hypothetical protein A2350_12430 [Candidatus Raymondbacteria bacterium RifOxyB12_full_50_8]OGJ89605.1 MAG: hypothetical protein A2248_09500 [Candidatus Raymondbacteria bacterium RIFOXYA2_FULL_49_16]OGK02624.1 MAG: hypothetical protein A2519_11215 [Candidatus Raymondbacteria bacterium RIFOXYD12_FULL_49_13]OGP42861.1 MAG: hypothetical protein A2324_01915 [Candidatus Raymondbacteria 